MHAPDSGGLTCEMLALRDAVVRANHLFDNAQPGLATWNECLRFACVGLQSALCSLGATPEACGIKRTLQ